MSLPKITVCICTYKRPELLARLLERLGNQVTNRQFEYSIVVVDNDSGRSAEPIVRQALSAAPLRIVYAMEPQANIAIARNRTLELADGDYAAFIDDDEYPEDTWLAELLATALRFEADGVIGCVKPDFGRTPAAWISKGKFFFKPAPPLPPSGTDLSAGITSNALVSMHAVRRAGVAFDPSFGRSGGEDDRFFRAMLARGMRLVFCAEAVVHETIPPERQSAAYLWKRHHLQGRTFVRIARAERGTVHEFADLARSLCAAVVYTLALPVLAIAGRHIAVDYALRLAWHLGFIAAALRLGGRDDREQFESYMQSAD